LAQERLQLLPDGQVRLGLKRPWADGTTSVVFEPLDFLSKLAALVPPPRMHRTRYHGAWSSHAKARREVTPAPAANTDAPCLAHGSKEPPRHAPKRYDWARLLARVFAIDVLACPRCAGGRMQRISFVTRPTEVRAVLASVGLPADSPPIAPSRLGSPAELFDVA
jgi:hypothetical protein